MIKERNRLPNNSVLSLLKETKTEDKSNLKALADKKLYMVLMTKLVIDKLKNIMGKVFKGLLPEGH